jgi:heme A synthase
MIPRRDRWFERCSIILAVASLLSVVTGAAFTTNEERPFYSLGQSHLMIGVFTGILTVGLVIWLLRTDKRIAMRRLAWIALAIVIAETFLGFIAVPQPPAVRFAHAFLAQLFFAATVAFAFFTSRLGARFLAAGGCRPSMRMLAVVAGVLVLGQTALGVAFRHGILDVMSHVLGALVVAIFVAILAMLLIYRPENEPLRPAGVTFLVVIGIQFFLGLTLYSIGLASDIDPEVVIMMTMVHAAVAALTLAASVVTAVVVLCSVPAR